VGIIVHKKLGDKIAAGEALCTVHYNSAERFGRAKPLIVRSYTIGSSFTGQKRPLIGRVIGGESAVAAK
jgi:thymidine phosphorylase